MADPNSTVEYRDVPGFPGYRVGVLANAWRRIRSCIIRRYHCVGLRQGSVKRCCILHNLVLEAFVGPRPEGMLGLHRDDDRDNNSLKNLYWGSPKDNAADRRRNGRENVTGHATLTEEHATEIKRQRREGVSVSDLIARFGVSAATLQRIFSGDRWARSPGELPPKFRAVKVNTHCHQGHALSGENLYVSAKGSRACRACGRLRKREARRLP